MIQALRPHIATAVVSDDMSNIEKFQNQVLRPIIKFQHEILSELFKMHLVKKKINTNAWDVPTKEKYIQKTLSNDQVLRNIVIGTIVGMMDETEISTFHNHETEMRNRISKMIGQRLVNEI